MEPKTVRVNTPKSYDVTIGAGLLNNCGERIISAVRPCHMAVITDSTVETLYLSAVRRSLERAGFAVSVFSFPAGEKSKNMRTLSDILEFLAESHLTRTDCIAALGGGVVGDTAGFAAGCYLRGIRFVQLPTTLLAAVDSSVGGKTAIDLTAGKNLAGVFHQPSAVICDADCLKTLPGEVFADGMAEVIKTGILAGGTLFSLLEQGNIQDNLTDIIAQCVAYKGNVVEADELENGPRRTLNLGHTVGHAVEKCSGYSISHGHAVAIGTAVIARAAAKLGYCEKSCAERIEGVLMRNGLPTKASFTAEQLAGAALSDKKRAGDGITLVIPRAIGACILEKFPVSGLLDIVRAGMEDPA